MRASVSQTRRAESLSCTIARACCVVRKLSGLSGGRSIALPKPSTLKEGIRICLAHTVTCRATAPVVALGCASAPEVVRGVLNRTSRASRVSTITFFSSSGSGRTIAVIWATSTRFSIGFEGFATCNPRNTIRPAPSCT